MDKAINEILANKFLKLMEENAFDNSRHDAAVCCAEKEFTETLNDNQQKLFSDLDELYHESETDRMERAFRLGFLEGMKVGVKLL